MTKKLTQPQRRALELLTTKEFVQLHLDNYQRHGVRYNVIQRLVEMDYLKYINASSAVLTPAGAAAIGRADLFADLFKAAAPAQPAGDFGVGDLVTIKPDVGYPSLAVEKRRWQAGRNVGVILSINHRAKVSFHDGGVEYDYFFERDELELADIAALSSETPAEPGSDAKDEYTREDEPRKDAEIAKLRQENAKLLKSEDAYHRTNEILLEVLRRIRDENPATRGYSFTHVEMARDAILRAHSEALAEAQEEAQGQD